jgi:protein-disulfide isomerase
VDPDGIDACARDPKWDGRITAGLEFADAIGARETPTIIVNGWQFPSPPTRDALLAVVDSQLTVVSRR